MKSIARLMIASTFIFAFAEGGYAQMSATSPATPAAPAPSAAPQVSSADAAAKKAKAKECSAKADAQGLHGKARREFREKCKRS
jgi:hypothetical protein